MGGLFAKCNEYWKANLFALCGGVNLGPTQLLSCANTGDASSADFLALRARHCSCSADLGTIDVVKLILQLLNPFND